MKSKVSTNSFLFRRGLAYLLDFLFITIISTLVAQIAFINPNRDKYVEEYNKYQDLISNTENLKEVISSDEYKTSVYNISKYGVTYTLVEAALLIGYFVVFQRSTNGQTLGKKIFKIKVVSNDDKNVKLWQLLVRSLFLYNILVDIICGVGVIFMSQSIYSNFNMIVSTVYELISYTTIIMLVFRNDGRGLHDIVARTKVIDLKNVKNTESETENIVEADYEEVVKPKAKVNKKETRKKDKS